MAKKRKRDSKKTVTPVRRSCACLQAHFGLLDRYTDFRENQVRLQLFTSNFMQSGAAHRVKVRKIPVIVHIIYKTESDNVSDAQIKSQIDVLNKDFRGKSTDIKKVPKEFKNLIGDANIEFYLAKTDPNGKPTKGITRNKTKIDSFSHAGDPVKSSTTGGIEPWDTQRYLNIWVCALDGGLLGYAQFPGGPEDTDGVVIRNTAFGTTGIAQSPFHKGRTCTHEFGHYLNLSHIWGESRFPKCSDSDFVDDTPNQFNPNNGKPTFPHISCNNAPHGDMFMNYMDYVDDDSMFMFTHEQVARMHAALASERTKLGT